MESTVYIVDDDQAARDSVARLIRAHRVQAQTFASGEEFLQQWKEPAVGCVISDVRMTGMSGLELQAKMKERAIELPLVMITAYADVPMAVKAMQAGAVSFLKKPCDPDELWSTVKMALSKERTDRELRQRRATISAGMSNLTEGERRVLQKLLAGMPNKKIASELDLGLRTVELRRATIMRKLEADSLAEVVRMALLVDFKIPDLGADVSTSKS